MLPFYDDERRRKINLGGASRVASSSAILDQVRLQRNERLETKRRQDGAVKIQAWWRGQKESAIVRAEVKRLFFADVLGITGLRSLVLLGLDEEVLGTWSARLVKAGEGQVFALALNEYRDSWLVLIRKAALLLLRSVSQAPRSQYAVTHLQVLNALLSSDAAVRSLGPHGTQAPAAIAEYLVDHDIYALISSSIQRIPIESKKSPSLPLLMSLSTMPFSILSPTSPRYSQALATFFSQILSIPLLPNRIPLDALPIFLSRVPLSQLYVVTPHISSVISSTSTTAKVHLVANSIMFFSPHYAKLGGTSITAYLQLMTAVFNDLPASVFDPSSQQTPSAKNVLQSTSKPSYNTWSNGDYDSDEDDSRTLVEIVSDFSNAVPPAPLPKLDTKTLARLQKIPTLAHIDSLMGVARRSASAQGALISYLLALNGVWPDQREQVLSTVLALTEGNLVRMLYRESVRRSPLGKEENSDALFDPRNSSHWPPLLFLSELYTQALVTMGDDEFFGSSSGASSAVRNPLSIDELISFSRQLLNIAFTLYWREDQTLIQQGAVAESKRYTWEVVREKVTKCLVAIHARDSRKPFIPPDGWLVTSQLDMQSFVEAAVLEEQQLSDSSTPQPRFLSKRYIASMSPRLGVLNNIPFSIPFEVRVSIFRNFVVNDMMKQGVRDRHSSFAYHNRSRVHVRRGRVAQDGFDRLSEVNLKAPIEITFIDQFGQEEAGIDGGGVFKEFFTDLCKEVFDTDRGLWLANKKNELYPNPHSYAMEAHSLSWYRFIGRILGKAMYEGILVDVAFASFFLAKWLGKQSFLDDLASLDPELYKGLIFLKHYAGNPEDLSLNFTIAVDEPGIAKNVDLLPDGSNIAVTRENRLKYITLVSHYRLSRQIKKQSDAFFEGLSEMIDPKWLRMFNQQEVQILIGGVNSPIDLDDLREHTNYGGLYDDRHPIIVAFWKVVNTFDQEERRALLRFATSCSRPPLLGFKELVPNFSIRDAGTDAHRLPTSSTCVNLLKLPQYPDERAMRKKILQAVTSNAGFDLS